jgi:nucleoside 2-deoxyribosyltransferase
MNCFVIMPFAAEFDDVYVTIKASVEGALSAQGGHCFRLDEARPAGRINDRLLHELQASTICIADLTHNKPNVMWEVGFSMALGKPTIIITQKLEELPFDIRDMQSIEYSRSHLGETLGKPLRQMVLDTVAILQKHESQPSAGVAETDKADALVSTLLGEVSVLKEMVAEAVQLRRPGESTVKASPSELTSLEGHWYSSDSDTHIYAKMINGEFVAPYCFGGNNKLSSVYYDWRKTGDYWFARFRWFEWLISGFTFLKQEPTGVLSGAWWSGYPDGKPPNAPPAKAGVPSTWKRMRKSKPPIWALTFFDEVSQEGLVNRLSRIQNLKLSNSED